MSGTPRMSGTPDEWHSRGLCPLYQLACVCVLIMHSRPPGRHIYASPSFGEAYRDRRLTNNFEFWVEIFFVHTFPYEDSKTVSVHLSVPREKKSPWLRQYQSYIGNWYINGKVFTSTTAWKPQNLNFFFFKKVWNSNFDLCWRAEITLALSISVLHY